MKLNILSIISSCRISIVVVKNVDSFDYVILGVFDVTFEIQILVVNLVQKVILNVGQMSLEFFSRVILLNHLSHQILKSLILKLHFIRRCFIKFSWMSLILWHFGMVLKHWVLLIEYFIGLEFSQGRHLVINNSMSITRSIWIEFVLSSLIASLIIKFSFRDFRKAIQLHLRLIGEYLH